MIGKTKKLESSIKYQSFASSGGTGALASDCELLLGLGVMAWVW